MALPAQVKKQSEAVQKLYEEMNQEPDPQKPEGDEQIDNQSPEPPQAPEPPADDPRETLQQKYRTLQGMYNADTARLRSEVQDLKKLIADMGTIQPKAPDPKQPKAPPKLVTDKDMDEYGDSIDVMRRVNAEELFTRDQKIAELQETISQLQTTLGPKVDNLAHRQAVSAEQQFWSDLTRSVPEWQKINSDKAFQDWLLEVDNLSGFSRQAFLEAAQRDLDANRVANFFREWSGDKARSQVRQPENDQRTSSLEKQIAPGRGRTASQPANNQPVTYTRAQVKQFFADVSLGKYKGRDDERRKVEADIFAAQRENRIIYG